MKKLGVLLLATVLLASIAVFGYKFLIKSYYPITYYDQVEKIAAENRLPIGLVFSVIHTESGFDRLAESEVKARGLMQITEETFEWVKLRMKDQGTTYDDLYDPNINIQYGGWLLRLLLDEFETYDNALYAYHAGWGSAQKWRSDLSYSPDGNSIERAPYKDTEHYKYKVNNTWEKYNTIYKFT